VAVVGKEPDPGGGELTERRQRCALTIHRDAPGRVHVAQPGPPALGAHELDDRQRILRGFRVRHRHDRSEPTERRGATSRLDGLRLLATGFTQMDVEVDEPGGHDATAGVQRDVSIDGRTNVDDPAVLDRHVGALLARLVEHRATVNRQPAHAASPPRSAPEPSRRKSTAMRTATPLVTWSRITEPGNSPGSATISTPRFIGPGCITSACAGSRPARRVVSPYIVEYSRRLGSSASSIRSRCTRNRYSTSRSGSTASRSQETSTGQPSSVGGSNVGGATRVTCAPRAVNASTLLRATRLCLMS